MMADAEVIALAMDFFEKLGVGELELRINSIGCPELQSRLSESAAGVSEAALRCLLRYLQDEI